MMRLKIALHTLTRIIHVAERVPLLGSLASIGLRAVASALSKLYWQKRERQLRGRLEALGLEDDTERLETPVGRSGRIRLGWVSSWNSRCGIASYSRYLTDNLDSNDFALKIFASSRDEEITPDRENVMRCWEDASSHALSELIVKVLEDDIEALVVQFNFGFFNVHSLGMMIDILKEHGVKVFVMFHSTADVSIGAFRSSLSWIKGSLQKADGLLIHSRSDMERLRDFGSTENVITFPHGILKRQPSDGAEMRRKLGLTGKTVISSYGFLLPHKGITELVQAFSVLAPQKPDMHLVLVNSTYPDKSSDELRIECQKLIQKLNLTSRVTLITDFLKDEESLSLLECSDLIVFPYLNTQESASGAVKLGLASHRPVACTPLPIFDDVKDVVSFLPGSSPEEIAEGISTLLRDKSGLHEKMKLQDQWVESRSWDKLGKQLGEMIKSTCQR